MKQLFLKTMGIPTDSKFSEDRVEMCSCCVPGTCSGARPCQTNRCQGISCGERLRDCLCLQLHITINIPQYSPNS